MKRVQIFITILFLISGFSAVLFTSCKKDACKNVNCKNSGVCADGSCTCQYLYTGNYCETETRTKYYNTYKGSGTDSEGDTYTNWLLRFYKLSSDPGSIGLDVITDSNTIRAALVLQLSTKNDFIIVPQAGTSTGLTGFGSVYTGTATLTLIDSTSPLTINFPEMLKQ